MIELFCLEFSYKEFINFSIGAVCSSNICGIITVSIITSDFYASVKKKKNNIIKAP